MTESGPPGSRALSAGGDGSMSSRVVALAGGVGGAKLAYGLQAVLQPGALSVVVNTADDFELWGLHISPDVDTVLYTLAALANRETGWGVAGDTWNALDMLGKYGVDTWFRIGDRDMATHLLRTHLLKGGATFTEVTAQMASGLGIRSRILPMCDGRVETLVQTPEGTLEFQDYFVRNRHANHVTGLTFRGIESAAPTAGVVEALYNADAIVFCPSNPFVSIGPILAVPGLRDSLVEATCPKVAVSPIVGGAALKGPAAAMLASLGHEVSPVGVAAIYRDLLDGMIIDNADEALAPRITDMGIQVEVAETIMTTDESRVALATTVLAFCERITAAREVSG